MCSIPMASAGRKSSSRYSSNVAAQEDNMAEVPVTINGVLFPKRRRGDEPPVPVTLIGSLWLTGVGIWGEPIIPPAQPPSSAPSGIPTFPLAGYPDFPYPGQPIYRPGYPGGAPPPSFPPRPEEPPSPEPPPINVAIKPPPDEGGWGWIAPYGWGYFPPAGTAGPKR